MSTPTDKYGQFELVNKELQLIRAALGDRIQLAEENESLRKRLSSPEEGSKEARQWLCELTSLPGDTTWPDLIKELCRINIIGANQIRELQARVTSLERELAAKRP